ncbi:hypothetical protein GQ44DRAFT_429982 [Phaeosphaeriaceae sp. PMI808]|nr:hypothetical protein GQ44DRAFT_429982 [Phaeosphaeriaceae sp. PMI808]
MLDFVDEYFSTLTPSSAMFAPSKTRVFLRLKSLQSASSLPHNPPRIMHERRGRKRDFNIFVDTTAEDSSPGPASTRPRTNESRPRTDEFGFNEEAASPGLTFTRSRAYGRHPLSVRSDSANSTPAPSPHPPGTPSFRPREDLGLLNQENHDPAPVTTFPSTTTTFPNLPTGTGPPPPPSEAPHIIRSPPTYGLQPPRNTELYDLLGLDDWDVSKADAPPPVSCGWSVAMGYLSASCCARSATCRSKLWYDASYVFVARAIIMVVQNPGSRLLLSWHLYVFLGMTHDKILDLFAASVHPRLGVLEYMCH